MGGREGGETERAVDLQRFTNCWLQATTSLKSHSNYVCVCVCVRGAWSKWPLLPRSNFSLFFLSPYLSV